MENRDRKEKLTPIALILVFGILVAGIVTTGYVYYRNYEKRYRVEVERQLSVIGNLKAGELALWRRERLGDGHVLSKNPVFYALVRRYIENPDDIEAKRLLQSWLSKVQVGYGYCRVFLLDPRGVERMSIPDTHEPVPSHLLKDLPQILRSGEVHFLDFYREAQVQSVHLSVVVPILDEQKGNTAIGLLLLDIDPEQYLYPFISRWPTPSWTAETLLVRRDGNDALFLNQLKFQKNTALNLHIPLERQDVASVKAVLGQEGIVECKDYRGVPVIADVRAVPDSPWFLNCRIDTEEVYAPLRERLWLVILLIGAMVMSAGACMGLVWRSQTASLYRERYEAAQALQDSEEKLKAVVYGSPIPKFVIDRDHRLMYWNKALEEISGIKAGEVIGTKDQWRAFYHEERPCMADLLVDGDLERIPDWYGAKYSKSRLVSDAYEFTDFYPKLGKEGKWLHFTTAVIRDSKGTIVGAVETCEDITDSKQAEEALRTSKEELETKVVERTEELRNANEQLQSELAEHRRAEEALHVASAYNRSLIETSLDPLVTISAKGKITDVNVATERVTGCSRNELIGTDFADYFTDPDKAGAGYQQVFKDGSVKDYELEIRHKSGELTPVMYNASLFRDECGEITGVFAAAREISDLKQAEEKLAAHARNLELANAELEQFTYVASHDLQEPLRKLISFSELLREDIGEDLPEAAAVDLGFITDAAARMQTLVQDLLTLSRIGRAAVKYEKIPLQECADAAIANLSSKIEETRAEIVLNPLPEVVGDRTLLTQLYQNLIGNSLHYRAENRPEIHLTCEKTADGWVLGVLDNGIGIQPEYLDQIFLPFKRLHTRHEYEGTGIGLSICRKVVNLCGGHIWAESEGENRGAHFKFTFWRLEENQE